MKIPVISLVFVSLLTGCNNNTSEISSDFFVDPINTPTLGNEADYMLHNRTGKPDQIICDINEDQINDTINFIGISYPDQVPFDFRVDIKYSHEGSFKSKSIFSGDRTACLFYGLKVIDNWISIRYSDEALNDFTYHIAYDIRLDDFYLIRFYHAQYRNQMRLRYDLFDEEYSSFEVDAIKFCRAEFDDQKLNDTLVYPEKNMVECVFIPAERKWEIERYIVTPFFDH